MYCKKKARRGDRYEIILRSIGYLRTFDVCHKVKDLFVTSHLRSRTTRPNYDTRFRISVSDDSISLNHVGGKRNLIVESKLRVLAS